MLNAGPALKAKENRRPWKEGVALTLQTLRSPVLALGGVEGIGGMFVYVTLVRFSAVVPTGTFTVACWCTMSTLPRRGPGRTSIALVWPCAEVAWLTMFVPERVVIGPLQAPLWTVNDEPRLSEYWKPLPDMPFAADAQISIVPVVVGTGPGGMPSEPAFVNVTTVRVDAVEPPGTATTAVSCGRSALIARYDGLTSTAVTAVSGSTSVRVIGPGVT